MDAAVGKMLARSERIRCIRLEIMNNAIRKVLTLILLEINPVTFLEHLQGGLYFRL